MSTKRTQTIKVKDYGDDWINRLAVIGDRFEKMENDRERAATLQYFIDRYHYVLPPTPGRRTG